MDICTKCLDIKPLSEFYKAKRRKKHSSWCRRCVQHLINARHEFKKLQLVTMLGGKCTRCGWDKNKRILQLHHLDPKTKNFTIGQKMGIKFKLLLEEAQKCILLCGNCHAEAHLTIVPNEFMVLAADRLTKNPQRPPKKIFSCRKCHKLIRKSKSGHCIDCIERLPQQTKIIWPDNLNILVKQKSLLSLARELGISDNAIRKRCKKLNINWRQSNCVTLPT